MKSLVLMFMVAVMASSPLMAQNDMPSMLDNANAGTEFYFSMPPCYEQGGNDNKIVIYASSAYEANIKVSIPGRGVVHEKVSTPGEVVFFPLTPAEAQPFNKNPNQPAPAQAVYEGAAIMVTSNKPIIAYCVTRFQFTSDGATLMPNASLGTEYVIGSMADMSGMYPGYNLPSEVTATAIANNTKVWFTLGGTDDTQTTNGMSSGDTREFELNKGDVLAISTLNSGGDLSGSFLRANKPINVMSGNQCANVPLQNRWCDFIVSNEPPMHTWSKQYHFPELSKRGQNSWMKIVAAEDNTAVLRNGEAYGTIEFGKGGRAGRGYLEGQAMDGEQQPIVFTASKPISIKFFNPGQEIDGVTADPYSIQLTPVDQYVDYVWFCTPGVAQLQFAKNWLSVIHVVDENGEVSEDLEIGWFEDGVHKWWKVRDLYGAAPGGIFAPIGDGKVWAEKRLELPDPAGVYTLRSFGERFTAYSYGAQDYDTYAFRTGARMIDQTSDDSEIPGIVILSDEGENQSGSVQDLGAGIAAVRAIPETQVNMLIEVEEFLPGTKESVNWSAKVIDPSQAAAATIAVVDRRGNIATFELEYSVDDREPVDLSPRTLDFGPTIAADVVERKATITNTRSDAELTISTIRLTADLPQFEIVELPALPYTLAPAGTLEVTVRFTGDMPGEYQNQLEVTLAGEAKRVACDLNVTTEVTELAIASADFGALIVGLTSTKPLAFNINSPVAANILSISQPDNAAFTIKRFTGALASVPGTIAPGAAAGIEVKFAPTALEQYSSTIQVEYTFGAQAPRTLTLDLQGEGGGTTSSVNLDPEVFSPVLTADPNPASLHTKLSFELLQPRAVAVTLYDLRGVAVLNIQPQLYDAGLNTIELDLAALSVGTYYCRLEAPDAATTLPILVRR